MISETERDALRTMTLKEIRRAQGMVAQQLVMAYDQRNTHATIQLLEWDKSYVYEIMRRTA